MPICFLWCVTLYIVIIHFVLGLSTFISCINVNFINFAPKIREMSQNYASIIGDEKANLLLNYSTPAINKSLIHLPNEDFVSQIWAQSNRNIPTLRSLQQLYGHGRLANTGYMSILPVDQGIEHSAGASFAPNPIYFDSENIVKLALEAGCNAVASTYGVLGSVARKYAHKISFIVKINHNEFLSYPNTFDQVMFGTIKSAWEMGAVAVGATIYFGSEESRKQLVAVAEAFEYAHQLGMATVLWCYTRNNAFKVDGIDYHASADLSGQANHLGVTIQADIIKQKLPTNNGGYKATKHGKTHEKVYTELTTDNPIDLCRYQVANCYMGRAGLINSGGESKGASDMAEAIETAIINKRAGGQGLILGRKAFQKDMKVGVELINAVQDVYLDTKVTIA